MKKFVVFFFLCISVLSLSVLSIYSYAVNSRKSVEPTYASFQELNTHTNTKIGYLFAYPAHFDAETYENGVVAIGRRNNNQMNSFAEIVALGEKDIVSLEQFSIAQAMQLCAAESPNETVTCTDASSIKPFTTDSGLVGVEFYLREERTGSKVEPHALQRRGPYIAIRLSEQENKTILIYPPITVRPENIPQKNIRLIAETLRQSN